MMEHPSLKASEIEVEKVASEFLEKVRPIVENRRRIKETNMELLTLLKEAIRKVDELLAYKNGNAVLERNVLEKIDRELNR